VCAKTVQLEIFGMGGDCRDKTTTDSKNGACPAGVTFSDAHDPPKPKPKPTPPEVPLYLAQATPPSPPGQVSGIGHYGNLAPIAKDNVTKQSIARDNADHAATGSPLPEAGPSANDQARARAGAKAHERAEATRVGNQQELVRTPEGILDGLVTSTTVPVVTEASRRALDLGKSTHATVMAQRQIGAFHTEIQSDRTALAAAVPGSADQVRLQERVQTYDRLKLGERKVGVSAQNAESEMARLEESVRTGSTAATGFTPDEIARLRTLQNGERLIYPAELPPEQRWARFQGNALTSIARVGRGTFGAVGTYTFDSIVSSNLGVGGHSEAAELFAPNKLTTIAMGATWTLPTPQSRVIPWSRGGTWYEQFGARLAYEGMVYAGSHGINYLWDKVSDPDVEKRDLASAKAATNEDHTKKTSDTMNSAIDAWKKLGSHNNQINQALNDTLSQLGTMDPAKLAEVQRDLVALYGAYGESRLGMGTRVGGPDSAGNELPGVDKAHEHYLFAGQSYDFGGVAMYNLNTARNQMNALGISPDDPAAKRIYSTFGESDMAHILNPHDSLPKVYDTLKDLVNKKSPDAAWLSGWIASRVTDEKKLVADEESNAMAAKRDGHPFVPQWNNYVLAKVSQDQALLDMAYAADGQDKDAHMRAAHDALRDAAKYGWNGKTISVKGKPFTRTSDLPELIKMYQGLGGTVDW
jgi:hypothetical protein